MLTLAICSAPSHRRNSAALLARVDLGDWAVQTSDEYVAFAVAVAKDLERLARLRAELRGRMEKTLCDAERFTRELEETYLAMWQRWREQA
jgi:predicted O-linked N-acetylglucosamine transferase (SPINDLY family)